MPSVLDRMAKNLAGFIEATIGRRLLYSYMYQSSVITYNAATGEAEVLADDPRVRGQGTDGVTAKVGIGGATILLKAGDRVMLAFSGGDPDKPFCFLVDQALSAGTLERVARETDSVDIGIWNVVAGSSGDISGVSIIPPGGGIPVAKYYLPSLHYRMQTRDALRAVRKLVESDGTADGFHKNVCDCEQCKKVITGDAETDFMEQYGKTKIIKGRAYPTAETKKNSVRHYMWRKQREFKEKYDADSIVRELQGTHKRLQRAVGVENTIHCKNWADVLREIDK